MSQPDPAKANNETPLADGGPLAPSPRLDTVPLDPASGNPAPLDQAYPDRPYPDTTSTVTPAPGAASSRPAGVPRTRAGAAWVAICAAAVVFLALIIFIAQNTASTQITFLGLHGSLPLAAALLAAALAGAGLVLVIGTTRIAQLRRLARSRAK